MSSLSNGPIIATAVSNSTRVGAVMSHTSESHTDSVITGLLYRLPFPQCQGRLFEKINNSQFVDLRELTPDNIALAKLLSEVGAPKIAQSGSCMREIEDHLLLLFFSSHCSVC